MGPRVFEKLSVHVTVWSGDRQNVVVELLIQNDGSPMPIVN